MPPRRKHKLADTKGTEETNAKQSKLKGEKSDLKLSSDPAPTDSEPYKTKRPKKALKSENGAGDNCSETKKNVKSRGQKKNENAKAEVEKMEIKITSDGSVKSKKVVPPKGSKYVGAHTSISGGVWNAVKEADAMGAYAFGMFLKSQRQWNSKPLEDKDAEKFKQAMEEYGYSPNMVVPHGSYLLNCGSPNEETLQKSREALVDELQRCEKLGLTMFNFHPGSTCGKISREESINKIAESINLAHQRTKYVITVVENMSCQGHTIGGKFQELHSIIEKVKDKSRIGICLDTCHAFAAGHDLSTEKGFERMMEDLESTVGLRYLKAVHVNDSKGDVGCHLDRHENIGKGKIGLEGFRRIMNDKRFENIPFVLETPNFENYDKEIRKLYTLCQ